MQNHLLPGAKWRNTHQATVNSVLGSDPQSEKYRKVRSVGSQFYNKDSWYARAFGASMCEWARLNRDSTPPTESEVRNWISVSSYRASAEGHYERGITIAETPDDLSRDMAMALVGGAYHEAWHTEYSRRERIQIGEVWPRILDLWGLIPWAPERGYRGWSQLVGPLMTWSNIIEDIRIERIGCREFPGSPQKMEALQDLILQMEIKGQEAGGHRSTDSSSEFVSVVMGAFRDLGLGYQTSLQRQVFEKYQVRSLEGWKLVAEGKLRPLLDRAIALDKKDDMESLWIAMEVLAVLAEISAPAAAEKYRKAKEEAQKEEAQKEQAQKEQAQKTPPQKMDQADATPDPEEKVSGGDSTPVITKKPPIYKVGDQVRIKRGPNAGRRAEVVRASLPDPQTGKQDLEFALVEED